MSYNITRVEYIDPKKPLFVPEENREALQEVLSDSSVESPPDLTAAGHLVPHWTGESSGSTFEQDFLHGVIPLTTGSADLIVIYAGESLTGYRVTDGVAVEHEVTVALGAPLD